MYNNDTNKPNATLFVAGTQKAAHHLNSIFTQLNSITDGEGGQLENNLKNLLFKINGARQDSSCTGCDGTCSGCKNIVPQDISYQIDFRKVINLFFYLDHPYK